MKSSKLKKVFPVAWLFYLLIVFEILYMISPFALYYYSSYGPSLNFLNGSQYTAWLTQFFLPHYSESSSTLLNSMAPIGSLLFIGGLLFFLIGAGQIYYAKFTRKGTVSGGLYRIIRHPQYTALAITGLGMVLFWPRFIVLVMYVLMLIVYFFLARKEEKECLEKYGESYAVFMERTSMFFPVKLPVIAGKIILPEERLKRSLAVIMICVFLLITAVTTGIGLRNYSIGSISIHYGENFTAVSVLNLERDHIKSVYDLAASSGELKNLLTRSKIDENDRLISYIIPLDWVIPDLPVDPKEISIRGHYEPEINDPKKFKIMFAKARLHDPKKVHGIDILKEAFGLTPIAVVELDTRTGRILRVRNAPDHVLWGDIPTPMF